MCGRSKGGNMKEKVLLEITLLYGILIRDRQSYWRLYQNVWSR